MSALSLVVAACKVTRNGSEFDVAGFLLSRLQLQHVLDVTVEHRNHGSGWNREEGTNQVKERATNGNGDQHNHRVQVHRLGLQPWGKNVAF